VGLEAAAGAGAPVGLEAAAAAGAGDAPVGLEAAAGAGAGDAPVGLEAAAGAGAGDAPVGPEVYLGRDPRRVGGEGERAGVPLPRGLEGLRLEGTEDILFKNHLFRQDRTWMQ